MLFFLRTPISVVILGFEYILEESSEITLRLKPKFSAIPSQNLISDKYKYPSIFINCTRSNKY